MQFSVVAFLALASAAHAQLGDTVEQCKARYGDAFMFNDGTPMTADEEWGAPTSMQAIEELALKQTMSTMLPVNWGMVIKNGWAKVMQFSDGKCVMLNICKEFNALVSPLPPSLSAEEIKAVLDKVIGANRYRRVEAGVNDTFISDDGLISAEYDPMSHKLVFRQRSSSSE